MTDYHARIREVVEYVEKNLTTPLSFPDICRRSFLSPYHFHRVFQATVGETIGAYVRKRRLSEAARELVGGEERIIELALKYGYESQASFARAFKKLFRETPAAYRRKGVLTLIYAESPLEDNRLTHLDGGLSLEPELLEVDPFLVVGMEDWITFQNNRMPEIWNNFVGRILEVPGQLSPPVNYGFFSASPGLVVEDITEESRFNVLVSCGIQQKISEVPRDMVLREIPGGRYARFTHRGFVGLIEHSYRYIYGTWLSRSGLELAPRASFERFDSRFNATEKVNSEFEIFIPIH